MRIGCSTVARSCRAVAPRRKWRNGCAIFRRLPRTRVSSGGSSATNASSSRGSKGAQERLARVPPHTRRARLRIVWRGCGGVWGAHARENAGKIKSVYLYDEQKSKSPTKGRNDRAWQLAFRDYSQRALHSSEAQLMQRMRINPSIRVLKALRSTVFGTAQVGGGSSEGGMRRVWGDWACSRGGSWARSGRNSAQLGGNQARATGASGLLASGKTQRAIAISSAGARGACALSRDCLRSARVGSSWHFAACAPAVRAWRGHLLGV